MSDALVIIITAGLVGTACGLLSPLLILRRQALLSDAVSHAVLPGIVAIFLILQTRSPGWVILGAAAVAVLCVLAIEALRDTGLVRNDAAIALVFPALFALGVLGVHRWTADIHLDLDSTIYGEIAFAPFRTVLISGLDVPRSFLIVGIAAIINLALITILWKELKLTSFDPQFAASIGFAPRLVARLLLVAVAITAVSAFESVGAILVIALLIVPGATAFLVTRRLAPMLVVSVAIGWVGAIAGYSGATSANLSIAGTMGLACTGCFVLAIIANRRDGVIARFVRRRRHRRAAPPALTA